MLVAIVGGPDVLAPLAAVCAAVPDALAIQVRAKHLGGRALHELATRVAVIAAAAGVPVWVNDRADVALAIGAAGVHLPEDGLAPAAVRAALPGLAIGVSRHRADLAEPEADRVHLGPIWATPSKQAFGPPLGLDALRAARARFAGTLVAVGGIDGPERAFASARAGADAIAVIRALWEAADPAATARALVDAVAAGQRAFIASQGAP